MRALPVLLAALALAGCGDQTSISGGGRVSGDTLTVHSLLPDAGPRAAAARQVELGEKLALRDAGGRAGAFTVNYVARGIPVGPDGLGRPEQIATAVRDLVLDQGVIAVLGDLDSGTARTTVPLLNAAGILHVSPGASGTGFANPTGRRSFGALVPDDSVQAQAVAELAPGPLAVEAEGSEAAQRLAEAVGDAAGRTVPTARARTVFYAGSDPVNARGVVTDIRARHPRARILLAQELSTTDLPERFAGDRRVRFLTAAPAPTPEFAAAFRAAYPGVTPSAQAMLGYLGMNEILAAVEAAGGRARSRQAVIDAFFARPRPARPLRLVS